MLSFFDVGLQRGTKVLFNQANFTISQGWKVGIAGVNGAGKSSLLALVMGELLPDRGECRLLLANFALGHAGDRRKSFATVAGAAGLIGRDALSRKAESAKSCPDRALSCRHLVEKGASLEAF